jgi:CMP-N,N'-diacetyllegionaminic acid synthase
MTGSNIAFIPFRSGSTRLKNKNILPLGGLPLAAWSVVIANKCESIDKIILSTDSEEFYKVIKTAANEASNISKNIYFDHRPSIHSGAKVKIFDYIKHNLDKSLVDDDDTLIQLLPTSPFRILENLNSALRLYSSSGIGRFSAVEYDFRVSFAFSIDDNSITPLFDNCPLVTGNTQSQNHPIMYHPCGTFNIFKMSEARKNMNTIYDGCKPVIVSRQESLDIDTDEDYKFMSSIANVFKVKLLD